MRRSHLDGVVVSPWHEVVDFVLRPVVDEAREGFSQPGVGIDGKREYNRIYMPFVISARLPLFTDVRCGGVHAGWIDGKATVLA